MGRENWGYWLVVATVVGLLAAAGIVSAAGTPPAVPTPIPAGPTASPEQLQQAQAEWLRSRHANTYNAGQGANTTCAKCKSPLNWDPHAPSQEAQFDCASCKRVPGAPRPQLAGGIAVPQSQWQNIGCPICHRPAGTSYEIAVSLFDASTGQYRPASSTTEVCAQCHEGSHGFEVVEEQAASPAHHGWDCTRCHGPHGVPAKCTDCHDPTRGAAAGVHAQHPQVDCTACHDAGGLSIWRDDAAGSRHAGQVIPVRFAHTLTSWPSHNLARSVTCGRCHHPLGQTQPALSAGVPCGACHADGASLNWCANFQRNPDPNAIPIPER